MAAWLRGFVSLVVPVVLGGLVGGCDGGGGGVIRLYFGINGQGGTCDGLGVSIYLADANAVLARNPDGSIDCVLDAALEQDGCEASISYGGGEYLDISVSGCAIPDISSIVRCGFEEVDASALSVEGFCDCASSPCESTPPVCVSEQPDPGSCEDCDNARDDDGNGLIDCDDPNCVNDPICPAPSTTNSHQSTTTTVTHQSTTTTNSLPSTTTTIPFTTRCTLTFQLADDVTVGSLQWTTDYGAAPGLLIGEGGTVECASLIVDSLAAFNDKDSEESLESGVIKLDGFTGPVNVAECLFLGQTVPLAGQFVIGDIEAAAPDLTLIVPDPDVILASIDCPIEETTTTIPPSTTLPPTTTTLPGPSSAVLFKLDSASTGLGALQFSVDYSGTSGGFQGAGASVACTNKVAGALFAPNDAEAQQKLTLGLIALSPFSAPTDLVQCTFDGPVPAPGDFQISIDDATDIDGAPATAAISVTVTPAP